MKKHLDRYALFIRYNFELQCATLYQAYFQAENYRDFRVGAAVLAYNGKDFKIFGGANIMNGKGRPKVCAEQQAIKHAIINGFYEILAVCVVGKLQSDPDKESGKFTRTLHPCPDCRKLMVKGYRLSPDTLIYTRTFDEFGPRESYTLQDLIEFHTHSTTPVVDFVCLS